jgi:hypothetical protein
VQKVGFRSQPNGCGRKHCIFCPSPTSDAPANRHDFTEACNDHDRCYDSCTSSKDACDSSFLVDLLEECERAYPRARPPDPKAKARCRSQADFFYDAVRSLFGDAAYRDAQAAACDCCQE